MGQATKTKVRAIVESYKRSHRDEYLALTEMIAEKRLNTHDDFASLEGLKESRALFEISETLEMALITGLSPDEMTEFTSTKGARWFARTFSEFALPSKI